MIACVAWGLLAAALVGAAAAGRQAFRFTVLHTNDVHSQFDELCDGFGGFARLRAALDAERARAAADAAPAVHLNAGDTFQGTVFYDAFGWQPAADFLGDLGIDAMCLGNHEFEDGPEMLAPFLKSRNISSIPIVVTNLNTKEEPSLTNIRPSTVLTINNRTVGVIGYLTPETTYTNKVGKVKITDEVESLKIETAKLRNRGVEFIIALGHSGLEMDKRVAREVDGVDAVVGAHSHSYLYSGTPPQDTEYQVGPYPIIEKRGEQIVPIVQAYAFTKYLGKLVLTFNTENRLINATGGPILLDHNIPQDEKTLEKVKYYKQLLAKKKEINEIIGKTAVTLDSKCGCNECNLANFIADSFVHMNLKKLMANNVTLTGWTDAAAAIIIASAIKSSINDTNIQDEIHSNSIAQILPYKTPMYKVTINGTTLLKALEHSASSHEYKNCAAPEIGIYGSFMHMSGIRVIYDMEKAIGSRVQSVIIRCSECRVPSYEPINRDSEYTLLMSKYVMNGGDKYKMIKEGIINMVDLNITEKDILQTYIKEISPVYAEVDNRIKILNSKKIIA